MQKILLIIAFITFTLNCFSQDYLILKDGTEKAVIVLDITPDDVKYQYYGSKSGVIYSIWIEDIRKIVFEDGGEEIFVTNSRYRSKEYPQKARRRKDILRDYYVTDKNQDYDEIWDYSEPKSLIGVKSGLNISNISGISELSDISGLKLSIKSLVGFHAGIIAQFNFNGNGFIQPELLVSSRGCKIEGISVMLGYLHMPIYLGYKIRAGNNFDILFGAGPYFSYGVFGLWQSGIFGYAFNKFDTGISGFTGFQIKKTQFTIGYDYGFFDFANIKRWNTAKIIDSELPKICNRNLKISLARFF